MKCNSCEENRDIYKLGDPGPRSTNPVPICSLCRQGKSQVMLDGAEALRQSVKEANNA